MTNEEMFSKNVKIAYKIASKYLINYRTEYEDIKQVALLGLWKAVLTFKNTHAFSTYAFAVISNEINYYLRKKKKEDLDISINTPITEDITVADMLQDEKDCIERFEKIEELKSLQKILNEKIKGLKPKEQKVCILMLEGKKQFEISKQVSISQPQVSRIGRKIKEYFKAKI